MLASLSLSCARDRPFWPVAGALAGGKEMLTGGAMAISGRAVRLWLRMAAFCGAAFLPASCAREDEAALRARLGGWVSLGETVAFSARMDCAAGLFDVVDPQLKSALPVASHLGEALITLGRIGRVALDDPAQSPDRLIIEAANSARPVGMAMRRAALEARACMSPAIEDAFHHALTAPDAVLIWDAATGTLIVLDRTRGRLVVAMGGR